MAEETVDAAIKSHGLSAEHCKTVGLMLEGGKGWTPTLYIRLVQDYGLENEVEYRILAQTLQHQSSHLTLSKKQTGVLYIPELLNFVRGV